ncbi:MAG: hypothetical protein R2691_01520 [Solirubrobacterales bacterium]
MPHRLTYANVVSTVALFLALSGGVVYAAAKIGSHSIKRNAVTTPKIRRDAVTTSKIKPRAVTPRRLALNSVKEKQLAPRAVDSAAITKGAVTPGKLAFPVRYVAEPTGGSAAVPAGFEDYPIAGGSWQQHPGQINVLFGAATATLAYDGSGAGACEIYFDIRINGEQVGGGNLRTDSTSPAEVTGSVGAQPTIDPETTVTNELTMRIGSNGACTSGSTIDSTRFRVLDFG